jgi:hypothetical protein
MTMVKNMALVLVVVGIVACGGHKKVDTTPTGGDETPVTNTNTDNTAMNSPEKMEEVNNALKRKQMIISRCLASAMENKEVPKNTRGKVTLEIVIAPGGKASSVKVVKSDIQAQTVLDCVVKHVSDVSFPEFDKPYETSYTYAMEAN